MDNMIVYLNKLHAEIDIISQGKVGNIQTFRFIKVPAFVSPLIQITTYISWEFHHDLRVGFQLPPRSQVVVHPDALHS